MPIQFKFNLEKSVQTMAYLLSKLGPTDRIKLMKLVYLADRMSFIESGVPITGDRLVAMKHGPVPSGTLDAINGQVADPDGDVFAFLHVDDRQVSQRKSPGVSLLSEQELSILDRVLLEHGAKSTWTLRNETHCLPEYLDCFIEGTSRPIPFERIAKASGNEDRFRSGAR